MTLLHHIPYQAMDARIVSENDQLSQILERRIEVYDKYVMKWHFSYQMPYHPSTNISPLAFGPWANMGVSG